VTASNIRVLTRTPSPARSLAKALSWRLTGAFDTFVIGYLITGRLLVAGSIVGVEVITKTALYYLHERGWARLQWGVRYSEAGPRPRLIEAAPRADAA
jgi:uncharacterized membrane protein